MFSGCTKSATSKILKELNNSNAKYLISFSKELEYKTRYVIITEDGTIIDDIFDNRGFAISEGIQFKDCYIFASKRKNMHFILNKDGVIESFCLLQDEIGKNTGFGVLTVDSTNGYLFIPINIGNFGDGFICELMYTDDLKNYNRITIKNSRVYSTTIYQDKIYIWCVNRDNKEKHYGVILVYDLESGEKVNEIKLFHPSLNARKRKELIVFNNNLVIYGYTQEGIAYKENNKILMEEFGNPLLAVIDCSTHEINHKISLKEGFLPLTAKVYNDKLYIIDEHGKIQVFNSRYELENEYSLSDNAISSMYVEKGVYIQECFISNDELYVFYRFLYKKSNIPFLGAIHVYNIDTGEFIKKTEIRLDNEKKWWGDQITVNLIDNKKAFPFLYQSQKSETLIK